MKTMKSLMLAGLTVVSLGVGAAMAQEGGALSPDFYGVVKTPALSHQWASPAVQAGSSDVDMPRSGAHVLPFSGNFTTLANPG
jgi:hypothetical protein